MFIIIVLYVCVIWSNSLFVLRHRTHESVCIDVMHQDIGIVGPCLEGKQHRFPSPHQHQPRNYRMET